MAIGVGVTDTRHEKTNEAVSKMILDLGYTNTSPSGIPGEFFTENRKQDLLELINEIFRERNG